MLGRRKRKNTMSVLQYPNPKLSIPASFVPRIDKDIHRDIQTCLEILQTTKNAAALAANQVGSPYNFFCYFHPMTNIATTVVNPVILASEDRYIVQEGCLSFKGTLLIPRYRRIQVSYLDFYKMELKTEHLSGFEAEVFQHECEHLRGENFSINLVDKKKQEVFLKQQLK